MKTKSQRKRRNKWIKYSIVMRIIDERTEPLHSNMNIVYLSPVANK